MTEILRDKLQSALGASYTIERELGVGGMATVWLAHDRKHDRDVAIKVLHPELAAALGGDRFLTEIKTTARLQHPHILPLLDSGEANGLLYYVMPFATGETLRARLEREQQLPIDDALRIASEVADALGSAHALSIIHRDIKPENILLQGSHAVVADFGIALAVQQAGGARMTQTGLSLGTPQYMSPEQAVGERSIDARGGVRGRVARSLVDVRRLGCASCGRYATGRASLSVPRAPCRDHGCPGRRDPVVRVASREALFDGHYEVDFDVSKDGTRFLMIESETAGLGLVVVPDWRTELSQLTSARKP